MPTFHASAFLNLANEAGDTRLSQIAARTGINKGHLSRLLSGERQPSLATATRMADAYGSDLDDLVVRDAA